MSTPTPALIGSSWDACPPGPDAPLARHLAEWVTGSAVAPELATANVVSLAGRTVLEALAGDRLAQLGGHANQYVTTEAARILRPLEPLAGCGGWWCAGLDPLADWRPMAWGCFRPDVPRLDPPQGFGEPQKPRKYEHPIRTRTRSIWLRVPALIARRVADRYKLALPPEVIADADGSAGAFWRWWAQTPALPLLVVEGAKKAAALLSIGVPAVALPGIWNGAPKHPDTGRPALLPDLAGVPLAGRPCWVLFDRSDKRNPQEPAAARRLGRLLRQAGAVDVRVGFTPAPHKGLDDHLVAGGSWEALEAALETLRTPALPVLRRPDYTAPAGMYLGEYLGDLPAPSEARLVALVAPMGCGKSRSIAATVEKLLAAGRRVVLITHRRSLGQALAAELGLPWADDIPAGSGLNQQKIALCIDSLCPGSRVRFNPAAWVGAVVVIDEATAVLRHALQASGTAIGRRRTAVVEALATLLRHAAQILVADAQLDNATLEALEAAADCHAYLIGSDHRPAEGRELVVHPSRESWRAELVQRLKARERLWISCTAAREDAAHSAQNLAVLVAGHWPDARVLVVDRDTVHDPEHDAHRLATNPDGIAAAHDVVIATPAIAAGLSVTVTNHFAAVLVLAGGTTDPTAVAQAAARVRDGCPRHLYAPDFSPGDALRIGCGSVDPNLVMRHLGEHHQLVVGQLAAAGWNVDTNDGGPWLRLWARQAAHQNLARLAFSATVAALLQREGYQLREAAPLDVLAKLAGEGAGQRLAEVAELATDARRERVIAAEPLTDAEAKELQNQRRRLTPAERAQLERWRIVRAWGLGQAPPTVDILKEDEKGTHRKVVFGAIVTDPEAAALVAAHDRQRARELAPDGRPWAPDLCREMLAPRIHAAQRLGLPGWLARAGGEWFTADDPELANLQTMATTHAATLTQRLGLDPGKRATTVLRQLLELAGHRLESEQIRDGAQRGRWRYRVVPIALPKRISPAQLVVAWRQALEGSGTKFPP
jgi:hypothetical protein